MPQCGSDPNGVAGHAQPAVHKGRACDLHTVTDVIARLFKGEQILDAVNGPGEALAGPESVTSRDRHSADRDVMPDFRSSAIRSTIHCVPLTHRGAPSGSGPEEDEEGDQNRRPPEAARPGREHRDAAGNK